MTQIDLEAWSHELRHIGAVVAGHILEVYQRQFAVDRKEDGSYVTEADMLAHQLITDALGRFDPALPVLSEENSNIPYAERQQWQRYWLVDPLDGTREFVNRRDDFSINIALIEEHRSILGMVYVPVGDFCYVASEQSSAYRYNGDQKQLLQVRKTHSEEPIIAVSFSHAGGTTQEFLDENFKKYQLVRRGSMVKSCLIAQGEADLYPRLGNTYEWDTAAGQCILERAGGHLTSWDGKPLTYNTKDSLLNPYFVAYAPSAEAYLDFT